MAEAVARSLREEAGHLLAATDLRALLDDRFGESAVVGSHALDLMSWRDLDLQVTAERGDLARFIALLPDLHAAFARAGHTVFKISFNDEWARPRGDYGRGYYWGLRVATGEGVDWKIDLWGWDRTTYRRKLEETEGLKQALERANRGRLLALKHEAQRLPGFRDTVTSHDVYRFVLAGAGDTMAELLDFCAAGRNGAREGKEG